MISGDPVRALAVLVAATPCPLILAAPVAYIAGVASAARQGVLMKGGAALEALAQTRTVIFDKTGTLTVGGARLLDIETAPGWSADEALRVAASRAGLPAPRSAAIVAAARERRLPRRRSDVREAMGSGVEGVSGTPGARGLARLRVRYASEDSLVEANPSPGLASLGSDGVRRVDGRPPAPSFWLTSCVATPPVRSNLEGFRRVANCHAHRRPGGDGRSHRRSARPRFPCCPSGTRRTRSKRCRSSKGFSRP